MLDGHMWKLAGLVPSRPMMKHMRDCLIIRQISLFHGLYLSFPARHGSLRIEGLVLLFYFPQSVF